MARTSGNDSSQLQEAIRRRATELFQRGGAVEGQAVENWYQAEAEILRESATRAVRRAVVVKVQEVVYTGEYESTFEDGSIPGEWNPGDRVPVRLVGDKLYPRRLNGRELQTTIVKSIGYKTNPPPTGPPTPPPTPYSCYDPPPSSNHAPCG